MKNKHIVGVALVAGILATAMTGAWLRLPEQTQNHTRRTQFRVGLSAPIETVDNADYASIGAGNIISATHVGLYISTQTGKPVRAIAAEAPHVSADHRTYTFKLRDSKWNDNSTVTASDFVYAWRRMVDPKTKARNASRLDAIQNAAAIRAGKLPVTALGVQALDAHTLRFTLTSPQPFLNELLATAAYLPVNSEYVHKMGDNYGSSSRYVMSNGPYILKDWSGPKDRSWRLERNFRYTLGSHKPLSKITFHVQSRKAAIADFKAGKLDYVPLTANEAKLYREQPRFKSVRTGALGFLFFNMQNGVTTNTNLRKAIATGFDKHYLTQGLLFDGSQPLDGIITSSLKAAPGDTGYRQMAGPMMTTALRDARAHWQNAQRELGKKNITITLNIADNGMAVIVGKFLKQQLENNLPGLTVKVVATSLPERIKVDQSGQFNMIFNTWTPSSSDVTPLLAMMTSNVGDHGPRYNSPTYDRIVHEFMSRPGLSDSERTRLMMQAERQVTEVDTAVVGILQLGNSYFVSDLFSDLTLTPNGLLNYEALHE